MNRSRVRTFSADCRERYGQAIGKIPLSLGFPCPNRSKGGCIYCHPASFTPFSLRAGDSLDEQIRRGKAHLLKGRFRQYLIYVQQETPTALDTARFIALLAHVLDDPDCRGLIISTRPDAIAADLPAALGGLMQRTGKTCLVELGLQTMHERSLQRLNRNHTYADFVDAVHRLDCIENLDIGVHLILGIPDESEADMLATVRAVCALPIRALKLHHLQVIEGTPLQRLYQEGFVAVFTRQAYLELLLRILPSVPSHIVIHRLWSSAPPRLLVAPQWHCLHGELSAQFHQLLEEQNIWQGQDANNVPCSAEEPSQ